MYSSPSISDGLSIRVFTFAKNCDLPTAKVSEHHAQLKHNLLRCSAGFLLRPICFVTFIISGGEHDGKARVSTRVLNLFNRRSAWTGQLIHEQRLNLPAL
jgi:hypothetical protein